MAELIERPGPGNTVERVLRLTDGELQDLAFVRRLAERIRANATTGTVTHLTAQEAHEWLLSLADLVNGDGEIRLDR